MNNVFSIFVIMVISFGLLFTPFSFAQTNENKTDTIELKESVSIVTNSTNVDDLPEQETEDEFDTTTDTNLGQQVANFVHESRDLFEQQKEETKAAISLCRENLRNAEPDQRDSVREQCRSNLDEIKESYHTLRETYYDAFKAFRENMKIFIQEYKGLPINATQRDAAITNIETLHDDQPSDKIRELKQQISEELREEKKQLREQEKLERELAREERKEERKMMKEQMKQERDELRTSLEGSDDAEDAAKEIQEASQAIMRAENKINEAQTDGKDVSVSLEKLAEAKELLALAKDRFASDAFTEAEELADDAKDLASESRMKFLGKSPEDIDEREDSDDESENELEIKVEVEDGVAKIKVENNGDEEKFEMEWTNEQDIIEEIASITGLTIAKIEEVIEFEIESIHSDEDDSEDDSEDQ